MATYPTGIFSPNTPAPTSKLNSPSHAGMHTTVNAEVVAIETVLGISPEGASTTVGARIAVVESDKFDKSNVSTNTNLGTSDTEVPSVNAIKTYVDNHTSTGGGVSWSTGTFTNGDLTTGILTITHDKGLSDPFIFSADFFDNNGDEVYPDSGTPLTNTKTYSLLNFGTLTGTWNYRYL